jgi:putative SOS response-associated peptidase YedK
MCFHYSLTKERTEIALQLHATWDDPEGWQPVYHADGFTFLQMPVISMENPDKIQLMHWGLIPFWIKNKVDADKIRAQTLNAKAETIFEKPSFRNPIIKSRCLIIADGFYEWMDFQKKKYPHLVYLKDHRLFCFAGICSTWTDKQTGEHINSFSIITTEANPLMARIHNLKKRMPVILHPHQYKEWLKKDLSREKIQSLLQQFPENEMAYHTISKLITSRTQSSNVPEVTEPLIYPELHPNDLF